MSDIKINLLEQGQFEFLDRSDSLSAPKPPSKKPKSAVVKTESGKQPKALPQDKSSRHEVQPLVSSRTGKARVFRGKKHIISVSITPHVLAKVDEWATKRGMSRPAAIAFALNLLPD